MEEFAAHALYYASMHMHWMHTVVGFCVCLCVCNSDFLKVAKKTALVNAVQAQYENILNVIVLDF